MSDICGVASDAVDGTTVHVEIDFPESHKSHSHMVLIQGTGSDNYVLWWEEVTATGNVFEAIVPKSVREKVRRVQTMVEAPSDEFEHGETVVKGKLPVGVLKVKVKRSALH